MSRDEFIRICMQYAELRGCRLNPDEAHLSRVIDGIMAKQEKTSLRYCPCRLGETWDCLCPCNFEVQETWKTKGECWCGLFARK